MAENEYEQTLQRLERHQTFEMAWCAQKLRCFMDWDTAQPSMTMRPAEIADAIIPLAQCVAYLLDRSEREASTARGADGMGARLVERAMGPSIDEMTDVLAATQHALDIERGRVERVARMALELLGELPGERREAHADLARELVQLVARQQAEDETADLMGGA